MAARRPFRFGVSVRKGASGEDWAGKARKAEALGYSTFLVPDHFGDQLAATPALAAAADATTRIRVGSFVYSNDFRHPVLLAKEAATLDVFSEGRFELGIGAGWLEAEYRATGIGFDRADTRLDRLSESVAIVKRLLRGDTVSFEGAHYALDGAECRPRPVQAPAPPLLIGGSRQRLLEFAGREADIVSLAPRSDGRKLAAADVKDSAERVWKAAAGRDVELNILVFAVSLAKDRSAGMAEVAREEGLTEEVLNDSPHVLVGRDSEIAEELLERREELGISYISVFEDAMEAFAPVVERLSGR